jgi:hypothetical protein
MMLVSWAPLLDRAQDLTPQSAFTNRLFGSFNKGLVLAAAFTSPVFDPLKRKIFSTPVYWHSRDLTGEWAAVEARAQGVLRHYFSTSGVAKRTFVTKIHRRIFAACAYPVRLGCLISYYWSGRGRVTRVAFNAIRGDKVSKERIKRSFKFFRQQLLGRTLGGD